MPIPPFQSRSTGADKMAEIRSSGDSAETVASMPRAVRACCDTGTDFADRGQTPPPGEISASS